MDRSIRVRNPEEKDYITKKGQIIVRINTACGTLLTIKPIITLPMFSVSCSLGASRVLPSVYVSLHQRPLYGTALPLGTQHVHLLGQGRGYEAHWLPH